MHKKIDFCINSGQNGYFVLRLKKYLRNTKSSSVESFILIDSLGLFFAGSPNFS